MTRLPNLASYELCYLGKGCMTRCGLCGGVVEWVVWWCAGVVVWVVFREVVLCGLCAVWRCRLCFVSWCCGVGCVVWSYHGNALSLCCIIELP